MEIVSCGDNSYYDFETMKLLRKAVYSNDLIMCHILSYIPDVRVSWDFQYIQQICYQVVNVLDRNILKRNFYNIYEKKKQK